MIKKLAVIFLLLILFYGVLPVSAREINEYIPYDVNLWVDNQLVVTNREYLTQNGHMLVPAEAVVEMLGASLRWEPDQWEIGIQSEERTLTMYIANYHCANGPEIERMPAQPTLLRDTVMIPLRYVAEALGAVVAWNGKTKSVIVSTTGEIQEPAEIKSKDLNTELQMKKTVVVDPGHGGSDPGAVAGKYKEKDLNLQVAKILKEMLADAGVTVYLTRAEDKYVGLYERAAIANNLKADLLVSIHHNASPNTSVTGLMSLYYPTSNNQGMNGQKLAQIIQKNMVSVLKTKDWGIIPRPNLVVLRETRMPAVIAELGYMTNKAEMERMAAYEFQKQAAQSLFNGIMEALRQQ